MTAPTAARTPARSRAIAVLSAAAALGVTAALAAGPAARAAEPASHHKPAAPALTAKVRRAIAEEGLRLQVSDGWGAVAGPAAKIDDVQVTAATDHIGTIADFTGHDETGTAVLIFTGSGQARIGFGITGAAVTSTDNDTGRTWYAYSDSDKLDAVVKPGTAENIPPADVYDFSFNIGLSGGPTPLGGNFRL